MFSNVKMWFAYMENSMVWYDIDVSEVKKMVLSTEKTIKHFRWKI